PKALDRRGRGVARGGQREREAVDPGGVKPGIHALQPQEAVEQQSGADQERERKRKLCHDEGPAGRVRAASRAGARGRPAQRRAAPRGARPDSSCSRAEVRTSASVATFAIASSSTNPTAPANSPI